jgi:hypothetical protein
MHYRMFLQERPFTIYTDHQPLIALLKKSIIEDSRTQRWIWTIQEYSFELKYRKGPDNANADGLSRLPIANPPPSVSAVVHTVGRPTSKKARVKTHIYCQDCGQLYANLSHLVWHRSWAHPPVIPEEIEQIKLDDKTTAVLVMTPPSIAISRRSVCHSAGVMQVDSGRQEPDEEEKKETAPAAPAPTPAAAPTAPAAVPAAIPAIVVDQ